MIKFKQHTQLSLSVIWLSFTIIACVVGQEGQSQQAVAITVMPTQLPSTLEVPTPTNVAPTPTDTPTEIPLLPTATPISPTPAPATEALAAEATESIAPAASRIDSFTAEAVDNGDGGKTVTFNWQTTGATSVRIFNGATFVRFGTWWTDLPPDGTLTVEIGGTAYKHPRMALHAADAQGNEVSQDVRIEMPCKIEDKVRGNSTPPGTICPSEAIETLAAEQRFENGFMIWLKDVSNGTIFVFYDDGQVNQFADRWQSDQPESDPNITPPSGLYQPVRGFGQVWRENKLQDRLGWAIEEEQGFDGMWQRDMSASPSSDKAFLINRDFQLIRIAGPTSGGNWEFRMAAD